jgi:hypothetical protein
MGARRDWTGSLIGLAVFAGGIVMLVTVFGFAKSLFDATPQQALGLSSGEAIRLETTGANLVMLLVRCLVLLVLAVVGSLVASKGATLYGQSLVRAEPLPADPPPPPASPSPQAREGQG